MKVFLVLLIAIFAMAGAVEELHGHGGQGVSLDITNPRPEPRAVVPTLSPLLTSTVAAKKSRAILTTFAPLSTTLAPKKSRAVFTTLAPLSTTLVLKKSRAVFTTLAPLSTTLALKKSRAVLTTLAPFSTTLAPKKVRADGTPNIKPEDTRAIKKHNYAPTGAAGKKPAKKQ